MSWLPNDLVSDADLVRYRSNILQQFGPTTWRPRRQAALEDWLFPALRSRGFDPHRLRTRYTADAVYGYTGSAWTDYTTASTNTTDADVPLATILATPASDVLYIGSTQVFTGLWVRIVDTGSSVNAVLSGAVWSDGWMPIVLADGTAGFTRGGPIRWSLGDGWERRPLNGSEDYYWLKLTVGSTPTGASARQVSLTRRSVLSAPATWRTLELIYREGLTSAQGGSWLADAEYCADQAERALTQALPLCGGEFDTGATPDDVLTPTETQATAEASSGGGWRLERG